MNDLDALKRERVALLSEIQQLKLALLRSEVQRGIDQADAGDFVTSNPSTMRDTFAKSIARTRERVKAEGPFWSERAQNLSEESKRLLRVIDTLGAKLDALHARAQAQGYYLG